MQQLSWPERFAVEIHPRMDTGEVVTYNVTTCLHAYKAVAMAVAYHADRQPDSLIYDVIVTPLGKVPGYQAGKMEIPRRDLVDRYEF
jgi:hypothetical protein